MWRISKWPILTLKLIHDELFCAGQTLAWLCWLIGERKLKALAPEMRKLAERSVDDCVVREALIALGNIGSRNDVNRMSEATRR